MGGINMGWDGREGGRGIDIGILLHCSSTSFITITFDTKYFFEQLLFTSIDPLLRHRYYAERLPKNRSCRPRRCAPEAHENAKAGVGGYEGLHEYGEVFEGCGAGECVGEEGGEGLYV